MECYFNFFFPMTKAFFCDLWVKLFNCRQFPGATKPDLIEDGHFTSGKKQMPQHGGRRKEKEGRNKQIHQG